MTKTLNRTTRSTRLPRIVHLLGVLVGSFFVAAMAGAIDLSSAGVERLDNGLTLIVLEDHTFPVVSVQALYKVGARNEEYSRTGLAHYLEHMAFRATENFPETEVVSTIYGVGGEWHGYTWLDQTTYFETIPREHLDLALRIEADRLGRLLIPLEDVEVERGAILAELHGYENSPASVLYDAVIATSFLQHPYRNNSIGWESDLEKTDHRDLIDFYRRHYRPSNLVLAVVGSVDSTEVSKRVRELFDAFPQAAPTPLPRTVEPLQLGERRVRLYGAGARSYFRMVYRAPSVHDPDWPAFLLLQDLLCGSEGVSFQQSDWGVPVREGARLDDLVGDLTTWFPPMQDPYVFAVAGTVDADAVPEQIEDAIDERLSGLRTDLVATADLDAARQRVLAELEFDLETTEDAAHQLAYFEGIAALQILLDLPSAIAAVQPSDIRRAAETYLQPHQRTIGWYLAGSAPADAPPPPSPESAVRAEQPQERVVVSGSPLGAPILIRLKNGLPVLFQKSSFSPTGFLRVLLPSSDLQIPAATTSDAPLWRHTTVDFRFRKGDLEEILDRARVALAATHSAERDEPSSVEDPGERLGLLLGAALGLEARPGQAAPIAIAVVGDFDAEEVEAAVTTAFADLQVAPPPPTMPPLVQAKEASATLKVAKAQAQLGYAVPAPPPSHPDHLAWRILQYVVAHGYEGRLGKEAIGRRGLIYYVDSRYHTDGTSAWIGLEMGVDPPQLEAMQRLLLETLEELRRNPPSIDEISEAQRYLIGRRASAQQSNAEISAALLAEWVGQGRLRTSEEFAHEVESVRPDDVHRIVGDFVAGAVAVVRVNG